MNGVRGTNINKASNEETPFWDSLPGVTQMWAWCSNWTEGITCNLYVIAGPAVALYQMSETSVWRASTFLAGNGATFDIISDDRSPSYMYPAMLPMSNGSGYVYVLGTQNISTNSDASLSSMVYAFNAMDLSVVWSIVVNSDTSNFQTANCSQYVWILTQNQSFGFSGTVVQKLSPSDGVVLDWSLDTQLSDSVQNIGVANGQFMVLAYGGSLTFSR